MKEQTKGSLGNKLPPPGGQEAYSCGVKEQNCPFPSGAQSIKMMVLHLSHVPTANESPLPDLNLPSHQPAGQRVQVRK